MAGEKEQDKVYLVEKLALLIVRRPCLVFWLSILGICVLGYFPFLVWEKPFILDFGVNKFETRGTDIGDRNAANDAISRLFEDRNPDTYKTEKEDFSTRRLLSQDAGSVFAAAVKDECSEDLNKCIQVRGVDSWRCNVALEKGLMCGSTAEHNPKGCLEYLDSALTDRKGLTSIFQCMEDTAEKVFGDGSEDYPYDGDKHWFAYFSIGLWVKKDTDNIMTPAFLEQALAAENMIMSKFSQANMCQPVTSGMRDGVDMSPNCTQWAATGACSTEVLFMNAYCRAACNTGAEANAYLSKLEDGTSCQPPASILPEFFPSYPSSQGADLTDTAVWDQAVLGVAEKSDRKVVDKYSGWKYHEYVDRYFSMCNLTSKLLMSGFQLRASASDGFNDDEFFATRMKIYEEISSEMDSVAPDLVFVHFDDDRIEVQRDALLGPDAQLVGVVLLVVFAMTLYHTKSVFLSLCSFLCVFFTFPLAYFVYRCIFTIEWFGVLNVLALFIITGLGADDTFVLHDAWVQSGVLFGTRALERRMKWTLRRSAYAMGMTSCTSSLAFFANAISSIPPLRVFGIWTGLLLLWDFVLSCTFLPAAIIIGERYLNPFLDKCLRRDNVSRVTPSFIARRASKKPEIPAPSDQNQSFKVNDNLKQMRPLERFFVTTYHRFMTKNAGIVVAVTCLFMGLSMILGVRIEPMQENPKLYPVSVNVGAVSWIKTEILPKNEYPLPVVLNFGIMPESNGFALDPATESEVVWDTAFDISSEMAQAHALNTCNRLIASSELVRMVTSCFWYDFRDFANDRGVGFPVPQPEFAATIAEFAATGDGQDYVDAKRLMINNETGRVEYFSLMAITTLDMSSIYQLETIRKAQRQWSEWIDRRNTEWAIGKRGGCTDFTEFAPFGPGTEIEQVLGDCGMSLTEADFDGAGRQFLSSRAFHLEDTITSLQVMGKLTLFVSWVGACILVTLATNNLWLGFFAGIAFASTIFETLALMYLGGFNIGVLESIVMSILVGISCDYITHLGTCIAESPVELSSFDRAQFGLSHLGITVFFGAATTLTSGFILFFCQIIFFRLFGWFIFTVVLLSFVNSLGVFSALCYWWGPTGDEGVVITSRVNRQKLKERRKSHAPNLDQFLATITKGNDDLKHRKKISAGLSTLFIVLAVIITSVWLATQDSGQADIDQMLEDALAGLGPGGAKESVKIEMLVQPTTLTDVETQYLCTGYQFNNPNEPTTYVSRIDVTDKLPGIVHHIVAFQMMQTADKTCPFTCFDMPETTGVVYSWAIGSEGLRLPDGMGIAIGGRSTTANIYMQMHYDNWPKERGLDPGSGLVMYGSHKKPETLVTTFSVGFAINSPSVSIPPQLETYTIKTRCAPKLVGPVTLLAYGHHMHQIGARIEGNQYRGGNWVRQLGVIENYDFDLQQFLFFDNSSLPVIQPGDEIELECTYNSMSRTTHTYGGLASKDEMCNTFILAFPAEYISESFCYVY